MKKDISIEEIAQGTYTSQKRQWMPLRERLLLVVYHLRMLNWWLYALMLLCFIGSGFIYWWTIRSGTPAAKSYGAELGRFVMEGGAGLIAGALTSFLIMNDPILELEITTGKGIMAVFSWRYLLTLVLLLFCSLLFLGWTFHFGTQYSNQQSVWFLISLWLTPVLIMSMIASLSAFLTHNGTMGTVIAAIPFIGDMLLHDEMLQISWLRPIFIPFSIWGHDASDWWTNRLTLISIGLGLAVICWYILQYREDKLLGNQH